MGVEEGRLPHAWVGQDVILCRTDTESWELVTLREVGELGLAYEYKTGEVRAGRSSCPGAR